MLEGDQFISRIKVKTNKLERKLDILGIWPEDKTRISPARKTRIQVELTRLCGMAGCVGIEWP